MAAVHLGLGRAGEGGGRHRRGHLGAHRPAALGRAVHGAVPVPRGALAVVLGRPAREALPLLRLRGRGRRDQVRRGEGGAELSRGGGGAGRPLRGRGRARGGGPAGRGAAAKRRARLAELLERTAAFYATFLWESPKAAKAREYLAGARARRGGAARVRGRAARRATWDTVLTRGQRAGYSVEEMRGRRAGAEGPEGRGHYDRFRSRIVFPIRDARGRVQGFGARALLPDAKPKYLNSPEGELYRKRRTLFGIERARAAIGEERAGGGGRGIHGRARLPPGRDRGGGRGDGDGDHARAAEAAVGATPRRWCWRWTPTGRGARRCCARRRCGGEAAAAAGGADAGGRGPGRHARRRRRGERDRVPRGDRRGRGPAGVPRPARCSTTAT